MVNHTMYVSLEKHLACCLGHSTHWVVFASLSLKILTTTSGISTANQIWTEFFREGLVYVQRHKDVIESFQRAPLLMLNCREQCIFWHFQICSPEKEYDQGVERGETFTKVLLCHLLPDCILIHGAKRRNSHRVKSTRAQVPMPYFFVQVKS